MKYAIQNGELFLTEAHGCVVQVFAAPNFEEATLFDTPQSALSALQKRAIHMKSNALFTRLVGVEEVPGETRREVVELEGQVDLRGLKFALCYGERFLGASRNGTGAKWFYPCHPDGAHLTDTLGEALSLFARYAIKNEDVEMDGVRIVGIREVTTEPRRRIVELTP